MNSQFVLGLDYGTNSVRALLVDAHSGAELADATWNYEYGTQGVILGRDPNLRAPTSRRLLVGRRKKTIREVLEIARSKHADFSPARVVGIGVDTTGSTPMPVDENGEPLAFQSEFEGNPNALAWLWKDHTSTAEATRITELASRTRPEYLAKCGGTYSSEWYFAKILHCLNVDEKVFDAAHRWVECADWIPAQLTGTGAADKFVTGICAAGHKAMFNADWGGFPDAEFLGELHPKLGAIARANAIGSAHR